MHAHPHATREVCGLVLTHALPVLAFRLAPSAEPAHHMTETILPDSGFSAGTANRQLFMCEHAYYITKEPVLQVPEQRERRDRTAQGRSAIPPRGAQAFHPTAKARGLSPKFGPNEWHDALCRSSIVNGPHRSGSRQGVLIAVTRGVARSAAPLPKALQRASCQ